MEWYGLSVRGEKLGSQVEGFPPLFDAFVTVYTELFPVSDRLRAAVELRDEPSLGAVMKLLWRYKSDVSCAYDLRCHITDAMIVYNPEVPSYYDVFDSYRNDVWRNATLKVQSPKITTVARAEWRYLLGLPVVWRAIAASVLGPRAAPASIADFCRQLHIDVERKDFQLNGEEYGRAGTPVEVPCLIAQRYDPGYESIFPRSGEHVADTVCDACRFLVADEHVSVAVQAADPDGVQSVFELRGEVFDGRDFSRDAVVAAGHSLVDACLVLDPGGLPSGSETTIGSVSVYGSTNRTGVGEAGRAEIEVSDVTHDVKENHSVQMPEGYWVLGLSPGSVVNVGVGVQCTPKTSVLLYGYAPTKIKYMHVGDQRVHLARLSLRAWRRAMHCRFGIGVWSDLAVTSVLSRATHLYAPMRGVDGPASGLSYPSLAVAPGVWGVHPGHTGEFLFGIGRAGTVVRSGDGPVYIDHKQLTIAAGSSCTVLVVPPYGQEKRVTFECCGGVLMSAQVWSVDTLYDQSSVESLLRWWVWGPSDDPRRESVFSPIPLVCGG
jgi:hypothetical protein